MLIKPTSVGVARFLQYQAFHGSGALVGRSDFYWVEWELLGEFDGLIKYVKFRPPGYPSDVLVAEKRREVEPRDLGLGMTHCRLADSVRCANSVS